VRHSRDFVEFVWLPTFERTIGGALTGRDRRALEEALLERPQRGALIPRTGGFRKLRIAAEGRGSRSGFRVIYFYAPAQERIYLVMGYRKSAKADLTEAQRAELKRLAAIIRTEAPNV
jgi:hypothetical protein